MTETEYLKYLNKYSHEYFVTKDEHGMCLLKGRYGQIEPYGEGKLQVWFRSPKESIPPLSHNRINKLVNQFTPVGMWRVDGDGEFLGVFSEDKLSEIVEIVGAKKRRKLSEEQKKELMNRLSKNRTKNE